MFFRWGWKLNLSFCLCLCLWQEEKDQQWKRAMDYLSAVSELNYMTQIVIMLYEDNNKVEFSWFIFVIRCHFLCEFLECELGNFIENKIKM